MTELVDAQFYAPLKTTLMPTNGAGTPTFTRATTKSIFDHEGILRTIPAGHQSHGGSRVVENLIGNASNYLDVSTTAKSITVTAGTYAFSMGAGSGVVTFGGTAGATGTLTAHAADRVGVVKTLSAGTFTFIVSVGTIFDVMLENITGKSVQVPSAYEPITVDQSTDFVMMHKGQVTPSYAITLASTPGTYTWENSDGITASNVTTFAQPLKKSYGAVKLVVDPVKLLTVNVAAITACGFIPDLSAYTSLTQFYCNFNQLIGSIPNLSSNTALTHFYCHGNQLTGSMPSLSTNTSLIHFYCYDNQLTGSISSLSSNASMTRFYCYNNQITGSIPNLSGCAALVFFHCYSNKITSYGGGGFAAALKNVNVSNNLLDQTSIDLILSDLVSAGATSGSAVLGGTGNAAPSAAGITSKSTLVSRGWTVTTN